VISVTPVTTGEMVQTPRPSPCVVTNRKVRLPICVMSSTNPASIEAKPRKERPISRRLVQVIEAILDGTCKSQRAACERYNLSESYVSRSMKKDKVRAFVAQRTRETIAAAQLPATQTVLRLLESARSEHVQLQASEFMLGLNGYHANPTAPGVNINVGSVGVGYILCLANKDAEVYEGEIGPAGGVQFGRPMTPEERRTGVLTRTPESAMIDVTPAEQPSSTPPVPSTGYRK
jgi:hypothetical protein